MASAGYGPAVRKQEQECPQWIKLLRLLGVTGPYKAWLQNHPLTLYWE